MQMMVYFKLVRRHPVPTAEHQIWFFCVARGAVAPLGANVKAVILPDRILEALSWLEPCCLGGPDLDLFTRLGVSASPGLALSHREGAKTCKSYPPPPF